MLLGGFIIGGGLFVVGAVGATRYGGDAELGGIVAGVMGLGVLGVLQLRITVTPSHVRIRHLPFTRTYAVADIEDVVHLTTVVTRYGVEADRVLTVSLRMRDGREVALRPAAAQVDELISAIQQARGLGRQ